MEEQLRIKKFIHIDNSLQDKSVIVSGWIEDIRLIGSLMFVILRDSSGVLQLVVKKNNIDIEHWDIIQKIPRQSIIIAYGKLCANTQNKNLELHVTKIKLIGKAIHPLPLDPTGRVDSGLDIKLNYRPLELRKPETKAVFKLKHHSLSYIRQFFNENDFIEVNTPKILSQGAEGGATLFQLKYFNKHGYLAQSPQLYKEQLMLAFERVYEISNYFRAEKSHTTRHLNEFLSVDFEWAFQDNKETMDLCEQLIKFIIKLLKKNCPEELQLLNSNLNDFSSKFPRITYDEIIKTLNQLENNKKYGDDITEHDLVVLNKRYNSFYFIVDWPVKIKPFYISNYDNSELSKSFDLQFGNIELASGGVRIHDRTKLETNIKNSGLDVNNFQSHIQTFNWGMPPHSGLGLGFDRLMMVLANRKNIRDVVLYPRDQDRLEP